MQIALLLLVVCISLVSSQWPPPCRFAPQFTAQDLLKFPEKQDQFMKAVFYWEGKFHSPGVGYHAGTGFTFDGHGINYSNGELADPLHYWTAPSKESIHLMLLALAINGNPYAQIFISPDDPTKAVSQAVAILTLKIQSYTLWDKMYPGFGGYIPWIFVRDSGVVPADGWADSVPALDNGEMIWGIFAVENVLESAGYKSLASSYRAYFQKLANNSVTVFYDGNGGIRSVAGIKDVHANPTPDNYFNKGGGFLDDPYEGELFAFFMDLYGNWSDPDQKNLIWVKKRAKLQPASFSTPDGEITVQQGFWFSSHEQWKYLEMPYMDVTINRRIFMNGERARTYNSALKKIPGFYASVSGVTNGGPVSEYLSALGIQEIASQPILYTDVITPYASMPVFLANLSVGLVWYHNMISGPRMQGPYGTTEAINLNGTEISPVLTWDSKITSLVGMLGGITDIVRVGLKSDNVYDRFYKIIDTEWTSKFPTLSGENLEFQLPTEVIPRGLSDFPTCASDTFLPIIQL